MIADARGIGPGRAALAAITGLWLGLAQVSLAFALIAGAGVSALLFFALTGIWLAGGALGGVFARGRSVTIALAAALAVSIAARVLLFAHPFSNLGAITGLLAGGLCGAYAAAFLAERSAMWANPRAVLLHENNGFVLGWIIGAVLLVLSANTLAFFALALGIALLAARLLEKRQMTTAVQDLPALRAVHGRKRPTGGARRPRHKPDVYTTNPPCTRTSAPPFSQHRLATASRS